MSSYEKKYLKYKKKYLSTLTSFFSPPPTCCDFKDIKDFPDDKINKLSIEALAHCIVKTRQRISRINELLKDIRERIETRVYERANLYIQKSNLDEEFDILNPKLTSLKEQYNKLMRIELSKYPENDPEKIKIYEAANHINDKIASNFCPKK